MEFEMNVLASAPVDEPCAQVGTDDYREASMIECYVFRRMLERLFPLGRLFRVLHHQVISA